jgi:hypothetical protein
MPDRCEHAVGLESHVSSVLASRVDTGGRGPVWTPHRPAFVTRRSCHRRGARRDLRGADRRRCTIVTLAAKRAKNVPPPWPSAAADHDDVFVLEEGCVTGRAMETPRPWASLNSARVGGRWRRRHDHRSAQASPSRARTRGAPRNRPGHVVGIEVGADRSAWQNSCSSPAPSHRRRTRIVPTSLVIISWRPS